jgi:hypothetical protein
MVNLPSSGNAVGTKHTAALGANNTELCRSTEIKISAGIEANTGSRETAHGIEYGMNA